jgi:hypothetical protein
MVAESERRAEYAQRVFAAALDWYRNADGKAQVLLTLDGAFLSFLTGSAFTKSEDLGKILGVFGVETWLFLVAMVVTLAGSIMAALQCLRSRLNDPVEIRAQLDAASRSVDIDDLPPPLLWFFGHIGQLDRKRFAERLQRLTTFDEVEALASETWLLSRNVGRKHKWVNRGFLLTAITFVMFLSAGTSYVVHVALHGPP